MKLYYPFSTEADTPISINRYTGGEPIKPHMHTFHEMVLVLKGTCRFFYEDTESVLIPGDVYVIDPHRLHTYLLDGPFECYNLMYRSELLGEQWRGMEEAPASARTDVDAVREAVQGDPPTAVVSQTNINRRGILHLEPPQATALAQQMQAILEEQQSRQFGYETAQLALLQLLTVRVKRAQLAQFEQTPAQRSESRVMIEQTLAYIGEHFTEQIDFAALASSVYLSQSHFRRVFKQAVGLAPVDYLNRLRIVTSLGYLQDRNLSVADAGAAVGITDPNYFSRLFKKIIGYAPRHLKDYSGM